ncbi:putative G-protein coupled receptor [Nymphon striatum]|nr:putative G-protein coupled receptor [Nymphon striatum]
MFNIFLGYNKPRKGDGYGEMVVDEILKLTYEDGEWSQPYYDCGGGNVWMMSYMVPFFGYENGSYYFKGTSGIDIDLRRVDIDQCPETSFDGHGSNVFAGSDKCKNKTTKCEFIPGLGFRRGSYNCVCKRGYYFPDSKSITKYYNGTEVEEEFEKKLMVIKAASPVLLRIIILGAFLLYSTVSIISVVFRVRSAKAIKITDMDLIKRLGLIVLVVIAFLSVRTTVATPHVTTEKSYDDLKAFLCSTDWWDYAFTGLEIVFLIWGIGLCYVVRKAPSEFNESRFISMAIYNEFFLSIFLIISMIFLHSPANPDLQYIIFFGHNQLTITLLLCLIFGSKVYMVFKGQQENNQDRSTAAGSVCVGKIMSKNKRSSNNCKDRFSSSSSAHCHSNEEGVVHIEDIKDELDRLYTQLQLLKNKNMKLGNRHLVEKINEMQNVVNSKKWKLFSSVGKCSNDSNIQLGVTNYSRNFLTPEIANHKMLNVTEIHEEETYGNFIANELDRENVHNQSADAISEKATSSGVNPDQNSVRSRQNSCPRSELSYSAKSISGDSNQNFSEIQADQSSLKQSCPKARNIVINLDDPEYFTQELTV